jgi:hypothetical protein
MSGTNRYFLAVLMDEKRLQSIRGTPLERKLTSMFGGAIKAFVLQASSEQCQKLLSEFPRSRTDARGFIEELPIAFKKALFEEIVNSQSIDTEVIDSVILHLARVKAEAEIEENYLTPPES